MYKYGGGFPDESYLASNYWVDVLFDAAAVPPAPSSFSLWPATTLPSVQSFDDRSAVELGVKFTTSRAGVISGIRFFKGNANTGSHTARLWSSSGTILATATFNNETASGWQEVRFSSPVPVSANTTYVASYFAPNGGYAVDGNYFTRDWVSAPLQALASQSSGGNGVYRYGGGFPDQSFNSANYWVDVVFEDVAPAQEYSLWSTSSVPAIPSYPDTSSVELGVKVQAARNGEVTGLRFYKGSNNTGVHVANVWSSAGALLGSAPFSNETPSGWQEVRFAAPVPVVAGQTFIVSYLGPNGGYAVDGNFFGSALVNGPLTALASSTSGGNGVFKYGGGFPDQSFNSANYWVDVIFR